ncbi:helix-turn-helix transcriptional regulator [Paenibacillus athensensis]|uniref:AraC family transcriptional regulator n=1 Tax=Paenibacillus athensensis TaxID=1967502 RepID=A0A4Y8QAD9_9BACL|nr:AraC family transcriptional regulator [Paenibacillus athensensis]MCD1257625.1 helix-turn-helix transcriptional regulator [Paenibacillus athensensis]
MRKDAALPAYPCVRGCHAGTVIYPPGGRYGPRWQQDYQLVLLHAGEMTVTVDGEAYPIKPGYAILLRPGHQESFRFAEHQNTWHRWIAIQLLPAAIDCDDASPDAGPPVWTPIPDELNRLTDLMLALKPEHTDESEVMRSLGYAALQLFAAQTGRAGASAAHPSVALAKQLVQERYADELQLQHLAERAGVSAEHLVRLFRQHDDTTPMRYVWRYRVDRAVELLAQTGLSMTEIADRCGFKTTFHLARLVKKQTGSTPSDIRAATRG